MALFLIFSESWQSFCQTVQQTFPMRWGEKLCQTENMFFKIQTKSWNFFCASRKVIVLTLQFLIFEKLCDQGVWCMTCMYDSWKHYGSTLHCAKGLYLDPENFSKELVLNFNLGPLKDLDGLIAKSYLKKQVKIGRTNTGDLE